MIWQNAKRRVAAVVLLASLAAAVSCNADRSGTFSPATTTPPQVSVGTCIFFAGDSGVVVTWSGFATTSVEVSYRDADNTAQTGVLTRVTLAAAASRGSVTVPTSAVNTAQPFAVFDVTLIGSTATYRMGEARCADVRGGDG